MPARMNAWRRSRRRCAGLLIAASAAAWAGAAARAAPAAGDALTVGLISTGSVESTLQNWKPLTDALAKDLQRPVKVVASKNYSDIAHGMKQGSIQVAWVSNRLAVELVEAEQGRVVAQMVRLDGSLGYRSVLLVRKESPLDSVDRLLDQPGRHRLAAGDVKSMSGTLVPNYYVFHKHKIDPQKHFTAITHASHRDNFLAIAEGRTDVATGNTEDLPRFQAEMPEKFARLRVIWTSPLIPNDPIVVGKGLPDETRQRVRRFFVGYGRTASEQATLAAINGLAGFKASSNHQLRRVVDLEVFESLVIAMREMASDPQAFAAVLERLTARASRLDVLMSSTLID